MDRLDIKRQEMRELQKAYKVHPEQFLQTSYIEDAPFLRDFGIIIPQKDSLPTGYLKLYPSDFIVEEISIDGTVCTINRPLEQISIPERQSLDDSHRALFATLVKCNITTLDAIEEIARTLGCNPENIHYAGLKDKNALTAQRISIHNADFKKISEISSPYYFLKDMRFGKGSVEKGALKSNRFTLFVRTPDTVDQGKFMARQKELNRVGFYNFYWLQRFGVPRLMNYQWGFDILRGKYKEAVTGYLAGHNKRELAFFSEMRKSIASSIPRWKNIKDLVGLFPLTMSNENKMIDHLMLFPDDYLGALKAVEDQVMLWVYGFASLLFNESISAYIRGGQVPPPYIPLLLSDQKADVDFYAQLLKTVKYYPPSFKNISVFRKIQLRSRKNTVINKTHIDEIKFHTSGVVLRFSLDKGQYATTMLSHLFNIISGNPIENLSNDRIDPSLVLEHEPLHETFDYFSDVNTSKIDFRFEDAE